MDEWKTYSLSIIKEIQQQHETQLCPETLQEEVKQWNQTIEEQLYEPLSKMLLVETLEEYQKAHQDFYTTLEQLDKKLETHRYLCGDYLTECDLMVFAVLVRFDVEYSRYIEPCKHRVADYQNLWGYLKDIYQIPAVSQFVNFDEFLSKNEKKSNEGKQFYMGSIYYDLILLQADLPKVWSMPTGREGKSNDPANKMKKGM